MHCLFHTDDMVSLVFQAGHGGHGFREIFPVHTEFGSDGRLVDLRRRRDCADAAKADLVYLERVAAAESLADIVRTAHVVQYYDNSGLFGVFVLLDRHAAELYIQ